MKTETDWDPTRTNRLTDQQVNDLTIGFNAGDTEGRLEENKSLTFLLNRKFSKVNTKGVLLHFHPWPNGICKKCKFFAKITSSKKDLKLTQRKQIRWVSDRNPSSLPHYLWSWWRGKCGRRTMAYNINIHFKSQIQIVGKLQGAAEWKWWAKCQYMRYNSSQNPERKQFSISESREIKILECFELKLGFQSAATTQPTFPSQLQPNQTCLLQKQKQNVEKT